MVSKLTAFLVLSFAAITVSVAQTSEQTKNQDAAKSQEASNKQSEDELVANSSSDSRGILQRIEEMVGLRTRIKHLSATLENLEAEMSRLRTLHDQADESSKKSSSTSSSAVAIEASQTPETLSSNTASGTPQPPSPPVLPLPSEVGAERVSNESFDLVPGDSLEDHFAMPVLSGNTPDWVKNGLQGNVQGDEHSFAICSTYLPDLEQCREDLKSKMMMEVRIYLEKNVLHYTNAKLPELTQEYVEKYWVKRGQVFDNVTDRPSGTYHQAWIGLHISSEQVSKVREWEKQSERDLRIKKVGIFGGAGVFAITLLSGAVGLLARREKAKLKG